MNAFINSITNTILSENELLQFQGYKTNIYAHENNHLQNDNTFINIWYYDSKKGGVRQEKSLLHMSKSKGLYFIKFGKRQYLDELSRTIVKRFFPNK